jgi:rare lipoprotein A
MTPSNANHRRQARRNALCVLASLLFGVSVLAPEANAATVRSVRAETKTHPIIVTASWYGGHHAGRPTASGEIHSLFLRTAAHRTLPFGTVLKVTNLGNGRTSVVRINDRGPFVPGRGIDLSEQAARDLAMTGQGLARVRIEVVPHGRG